MTHRYDDIIALPRHRSARRQPMPRMGRAAQFAPFAALSGYDAVVEETSRLTEREPGTDEERLALMDERLRALLTVICDRPEVTLTVFEPDSQKAGGAYLRVTGCIRRIDEVNRRIILTDRTSIDMDSVCEISRASDEP